MPKRRAADRAKRSRLALAVLMAGLFATVLTSIFAYRANDANERRRFEEASTEVQNALEFRAGAFRSMLLQMAGMYALRPSLSLDEFHDYAGYAGLPRKDRGVYTFGIFKHSPLPDEPDRMTIQVHEINPDVPYRTAKPGDVISREPVRMIAMRAATDQAKPILSGLIFSLTNNAGPGYMLVTPAYRGGKIPETVEARRKAMIGMAYLRFSEGGVFDLFQPNTPGRTSIDLEVYRGALKEQAFNKDHLVFDRFPNENFIGGRVSNFEIVIGDTPFTVRIFSISALYGYLGSLFTLLILAAGTALSVLGYRALLKKEDRDRRLLQSERQLRLVTDSLPALVAYIDPSFTYRFNNKMYEKVYHRSLAQVTGRPVREVLDDESYREIEPLIARALTGEVISHDVRVVRGATSKQYQLSLLPDKNLDGIVKGVVAMATDITERISSEEKAKFIGEFATSLAVSLDPKQIGEKIVSLLVPSLAGWCAIDFVDVEGSLVRLAASAPELEKNFELAKLAVATRQVQKEEKEKHTLFSLPLKSGEKIIGTVTLCTDHERHRFLNEDIRFAIEISLRAAIALENARLYSESQNLNRAKDNFLAMLSHELRTPMNVILGWLEILTTEDVDDETYVQALETLNRNARIQIQLINELLDVSRIINGKLTVHPKLCNLGEIADGAIESVTPAARAKQIECQVTKTGDLEILADPDRLTQILWNLLSNAIKFTPSNGRISVDVAGQSDEVILSVTDTGLGIDASFLPFVFDRFRQEESAFSRHQGGLGLGLSIVRYLAEAHGGSIQVFSEGKGQGARFTLVLPRAGITGQMDSTRLAQSEQSAHSPA